MILVICRILKQMLLLFLSGILVLLSQKVGYGMSMIEAIPGMLIIIGLALIAILIKESVPKLKFPAFGWVTILGVLMTMPYNPFADKIIMHVEKVSFIAITTPLLAFVGISVGDKVSQLKKMSWKIGLISIVVFTTIFFACALIAEAVLKLRGEI